MQGAATRHILRHDPTAIAHLFWKIHNNIVMAWYSSVQCLTTHIIGHFGDDFTGHMSHPTAS